MGTEKKAEKRFLYIVEQIREIIREENIQVGDKLPSERTLAERLQVGRSTAREALRSMELLGLIETRHGEGTFLADVKKHQLVEVLARFILEQPGALEDVVETRRIHERAAISKLCRHERMAHLPVWESFYYKLEENETMMREDIIREVIIATGNRLSLKIWFLLKQYSSAPFNEIVQGEEVPLIRQLLMAIAEMDEGAALDSYEHWMDVIE